MPPPLCAVCAYTNRAYPSPWHKLLLEKIKVTVRDENGKTAYYSGVLGDYDENSGEFTVQTDDGEMKFNAAKCRRIALDA